MSRPSTRTSRGRRARRRGGVLGAAAGLFLAVLGCNGPAPIQVAPAGVEERKQLMSELNARTAVVPPVDPMVLAMVLTVPGPAEGNTTVSMIPVRDGTLGRYGLLGSAGEALDRPGTYVEVLDAQRVPRFLAEVQDPRYSRGEGLSLDPDERTQGRLSSVSSRTVGGVLGIRIPFVPGGKVRVFTIRPAPGPAPAPNALGETLFAEAFPGPDVPPGGWVFEVNP